MTDLQTLPPQAQLVQHDVKRFPPDVLRWLLTVRSYAQTDELITGLQVSDGEFSAVLVTPATWRRMSDLCNAPHQARWEAERAAEKSG